MSWPAPSRASATSTIVAPHVGGQRDRPRADAAAAAAGRAARAERLRGRRHADRLRQRRDHAAILRAHAGPDPLGHQQGLQPRRRRDVFGDGGGGDGRGAAGDPERRRVARADAGRLRFPARRGRRRAGRRARARGQRAAGADVPEHQRARRGKPEGHPHHRPGASATTSPWSTSASIRGARPYYWIEEGQNDWEPHDRSDYQAVRTGSCRSRRCSRT